MFPLGSTVFPGQVVPLHIFEARYRQLLAEITALAEINALTEINVLTEITAENEHGATFGIALIDRGHEVGGGDHRVSVGTRVEVLQAEEFDDGRWGVLVAGVERIEVVEWLDDNPYPRAIVRTRSVLDNGGASLDDLEALLNTTIELMARAAGVDAPGEHELSSDPQVRLDQISALAPLNDFDRQQVLEAATTSDQIATLHEALTDKVTLLLAQLGD